MKSEQLKREFAETIYSSLNPILQADKEEDIKGITDMVNALIEAVIAERMPTETEKRIKAKELFTYGYNALYAIEEYDKWFRSRIEGGSK